MEALTHVIDKLDVWDLRALLFFAVVFYVAAVIRAGGKLIPLCRDSEGHIYLYSAAYERQKQGRHEREKTVDDKMSALVRKIDVRFARVELMDLMNHNPTAVEVIIQKAQEYRSMRDEYGLPPNGYVLDVLYKAWFGKYAKERGDDYLETIKPRPDTEVDTRSEP